MPDAEGPAQPVKPVQAANAPPVSVLAIGHGPSVLFFILASIVLLAADLGIKTWSFGNVAGVSIELTRENSAVRGTIPPHNPMVLVPGVLELQLTTNTGAVFGIGKGAQSLFIGASLIALVIIVIMFAGTKPRAWLTHLALAAILAGALGNLYDRIMFNAVRDMFHMLPQTHVWPYIFNFADVLLDFGVVTILVIFWRDDKIRRNEQKSAG